MTPSLAPYVVPGGDGAERAHAGFRDARRLAHETNGRVLCLFASTNGVSAHLRPIDPLAAGRAERNTALKLSFHPAGRKGAFSEQLEFRTAVLGRHYANAMRLTWPH